MLSVIMKNITLKKNPKKGAAQLFSNYEGITYNKDIEVAVLLLNPECFNKKTEPAS